MGISLKPEHLKRYKDIAWLLLKYGRSDVVKQAGIEATFEVEEAIADKRQQPEAEELARDIEKLGPTFIKLGQLLSTRPDLLPPAYMQALSRLQDNVEAFSFAEVEEIVTNELGVRISKAFSEFDAEPIAAASIGQVHRACMRDGREVVVKVQRPNIREHILKDLEALAEISGLIDHHTEVGRRYEFQTMLEEFRKSILRELDYRLEANNLLTLHRNLAEFDLIEVPLPIEDFTTSRILTMEYVRGKKITALSPLEKIELDSGKLADQLFHAYLKQLLVDGFFHADPHPGNVFVTNRGTIALLDLGMVARIAPSLQEKLMQLLLAISENHPDEAATLAIQIGEIKAEFDEQTFRRQVADLIAQNQDSNLAEIQVGRIVLEVTRMSGENGIRMPQELTLLGKALLNLDQVGHTLAPDFNPNEAIRRNAATIMQRRMLKNLSPGNIFSGVIEMKDFVQRLPGRFNRILDKVADNQIQVKVDAIDEVKLMEGLQKIANRITLGLVLAALIISAAMLMNVPTTFRIFGYPGLAMLFFLAAATGGVILVFNILFGDEKARKK
jgi:predicted unusual protein kinase regulating ubiquinone biosynthesis (AarF/ABC1/UbiB family)